MRFLKRLFSSVNKYLYKRACRNLPPDRDRTVQVSGCQVEVGCFTYGIEHVSVLSWGDENKITIGRFCSLSYGLKLYIGGNHRVDWLSTYPFGHVFENHIALNPVVGHPASKGGITIGNDVWVGRDVTILSGINVGDGAVIAANSTVVSDVLPYTIVGGNPARFIKERFTPEIINRLSALRWWDYPIDVVTDIAPLLCCQNLEPVGNNLNYIEEKLAARGNSDVLK